MATPTSAAASIVPEPRPVQNPLTLVMKIKSPADAQALTALLQKIQSAPPAHNPIRVALDTLKTVHFARFVFLNDNTSLAVITTYDGSFEDYINEFVDHIGDVFNALLQHMDGAPALPVQQNRKAFLDYVRANDLRAIEPFYSAYPRATVLDINAALESAVTPAGITSEETGVDTLPLQDIQGFILRGYRMNALRVIALEAARPAAARAFLGSLVSGAEGVPQIATAAQWDSKPESCVNVALTWPGLSALGLSADALASFPEAFTEGAVARAARVGDTGDSAPDRWDGAFASPRLHLLLVVFARDEAIRERVTTALRSAWETGGGCVELAVHDAAMLPGEVAHFGYRDGFAQPTIAGGLPPLLPDGVPAAPAGEFLLGYPSQYTDFIYPVPKEIGENGSFVAFRVLEQDCAGFERFLVSAARDTGLDPELIAAKLCGRWRSGAPLALAPTSPDEVPIEQFNRFDYTPTAAVPDAVDDRRGTRCPIGAHVRRMNPRSSNVAGNSGLKRRIVRRGLPYGPPHDPANPDDGQRRGLLGLFIGVSLQDQFEFLMSDWANKGTFAPGLRDTRDPVIGDNGSGGASFLIPIEGQKAPLVLSGLSRFVTCRGAAYGFLPSVTAIRRLTGAAQ